MHRATLLVGLAAVALAGCRDPYAQQAGPKRAPEPVSAARGHVDAPGPAPPAVPTASRAATPLRSPAAIARAFATRLVNWDWRSVARQQRELAGYATGAYAAALRANAGQGRIDLTLQRDRPAGRGSVVAVVVKGRGRRRTAVVVTRERSYTNGHLNLDGIHYRVYLASVERVRGGWAISRWQPQR